MHRQTTYAHTWHTHIYIYIIIHFLHLLDVSFFIDFMHLRGQGAQGFTEVDEKLALMRLSFSFTWMWQ